MRPRVYEELARGAQDDEYDAPEDAAAGALRQGARRLHADAERASRCWPARAAPTRAIVIVRDPRDVAPSLANHNRMQHRRGDRVHERPRGRFLRQDRHGSTISCASSFRAGAGTSQAGSSRADIPVHLIRYEDMQADTARHVLRRALEFAGRGGERRRDRGARCALRISRELQQQEQDKGFREAPRPQPGGQLLPPRRGRRLARRVDAEQVARIEAEHAPMMRRLGYELVVAAGAGARGLGRRAMMVRKQGDWLAAKVGDELVMMSAEKGNYIGLSARSARASGS